MIRIFLSTVIFASAFALGVAVSAIRQAAAREVNTPAERPIEHSDPIAPAKRELFCYDPYILPVWQEVKVDPAFNERLRVATGAVSCSEIVEIKKLDLNRDGTEEYLVRGKGEILCGGIGNCNYWIFEKKNGKIRKLLTAVHEADQYELGVDEVQKSRTRNYSDILLAARDAQNVLRFFTYRFDGNEYVQSRCMAEVPKLLRDGAGSWELMTCEEHDRRRDELRNSLALGAELPGCWSSGSGKYFKITGDEIFLSTNRFKPVKFAVEQSSDAGVVLQLIDRPQFYFFQEFVSFEFDNERDGFPLKIHNYLNREDLETENHSGAGGWVKDSCEELGLASKR